MKQILIYSNQSKKAMINYDPSTGTVIETKGTDVNGSEVVETLTTIGKFIDVLPNEKLSFIVNSQVAIPAFTIMKFINLVLREKISSEKDLIEQEKYLLNLEKNKFDLGTLDMENQEEVIDAIVKGTGITWLDADVLSGIAELIISGNYKFQNIDNYLEDDEEAVKKMSQLSKNVSKLADKLVNDICKIADMKIKTIDSELAI